ncbi:MAG: single-stranded-DNA-specific exonuclease RecJ [Alphaproteobacteria bacterium]|nr:single-stranded-DNA-specific exonuclease RecJ [Alphaproteobacteria bacterium]
MKKLVEKSLLGQAWVMEHIIDFGETANFADALVKNILAGRGLVGDAEIEKFLAPTIKEYMPDPFVLNDMERAAKIIAEAICSHRKIAVYGDYDVDGITSTAIFVKFLRSLNVDVVWHVPTRDGEGYGLNTGAIDELINSGATVLVTVDCGISCVAEVEYAKSHGLTVVVTDHHSPDSVLPNADAVVNPKRVDDTSGLNYLAGVGVAFLTLVAVNRELRNCSNENVCELQSQINLMDYMDLVALGTICDTMPLVGLNRAFVSTGLRVMDGRKNLGLRILMDVAGVKGASVYVSGFVLGPRLNAAGRLDSAKPALELLLTDNPLVARALAEKLDQMNKDRIDIQNAIMLGAVSQAEQCCADGRCSLFVCGDNWHGGVMGIIAGRLKDKYNRPSCVATKIDGVINGSGRSVANVDLGRIIHDALARGIVTEGGGHAAAAGFSLPADKEQEFRDFLEASVIDQLGNNKIVPEVMVDAEIDASGANMSLVQKLAVLAPFGQGNPEPELVLNGAILHYATIMGNGSHIRGSVKTSLGTSLAFVGFNLVGTPVGNFLLDDANTNTTISMLGRLKDNEFNGRHTAQFVLEDIAVR